MNKKLCVGILVVLIAGCGKGKGDGQTSDQQIMKLEADMQVLQQSVEMQSKSIKALETNLAQLKAQVDEGNLNAKAMGGLTARVEMLEADANGFEK